MVCSTFFTFLMPLSCVKLRLSKQISIDFVCTCCFGYCCQNSPLPRNAKLLYLVHFLLWFMFPLPRTHPLELPTWLNCMLQNCCCIDKVSQSYIQSVLPKSMSMRSQWHSLLSTIHIANATHGILLNFSHVCCYRAQLKIVLHALSLLVKKKFYWFHVQRFLRLLWPKLPSSPKC